MKIGSELVEIKPLDIENKVGFVKWKTFINIPQIEKLIDDNFVSAEDVYDPKLEEICIKIVDSNDCGAMYAFREVFDIDLTDPNNEPVARETMNVVFHEIKLKNFRYLRLVQKFVKAYREYYSYKYEQASSYVEEAREHFFELMRRTSDFKDLNLDMEKIKTIVNNTAVSFIDGTYFGGFFGTSGGGHTANGEIYIGLDGIRSKEEFFYTYFHELIHAVSGDYSKVVHLKETNNPFGIQSTGVDFSGNFENTKRGFVWLNEGFTDTLAMLMSDQMTDGHRSFDARYTPEIELINILSTKGKLNLFDSIHKIYFRHIANRKDEEVSAIDQWKDFNKMVDSVFGPRCLVKLDLFIEKNGINKAKEVVERWKSEDGDLVSWLNLN